MMHPQEYATVKNGQYVSTVNTNQITELTNLITMVQQANLKIVTLNSVNVL